MTFTYNVLTKEEVEKENQFLLLEKGIYTFQVLKATFKMSKEKIKDGIVKPSNPMIELQLTVWDSIGKEHLVYDYLVSSKGMNWKIRHFCEAVGLIKEYEAGKFNEILCEGKSGKVSINQQKGVRQDDGTYYKDKNVVEDYLTNDHKIVHENNDSKAHAEMVFDDQIPF